MNAAIPKTISRKIKTIGAYRGNVWGGLQFSNYIRAQSDVKNDWVERAPGVFRAFDLAHFSGNYRGIAAALKPHIDARPDQKTVLYAWRQYPRQGRPPVIYGGTLTDEYGRVIARRITGKRYSQAAAIVAALESAAGITSGGDA